MKSYLRCAALMSKVKNKSFFKQLEPLERGRALWCDCGHSRVFSEDMLFRQVGRMQKKREDEKDCRSYKLKCNLPETLETLLLPGSSNQAVKTTRGGREKVDTGKNTA